MCVVARRPDTPCAGCGKLLYGGKGVLPAGQRTCHDCRRKRRNETPPKPRREPKPKLLCEVCEKPFSGRHHTCSRECDWWRRHAGSASRVSWRNCRHCEGPFISSGSTRFCSDECRVSHRRHVPSEATCGECGQRFVSQSNGGRPRTRYCCSAHQQRAQRRIHKARRRSSGNAEPFTTLDIAERDGWRCHLCSGTVTRNEWSLDHLIPVSAGGPHTRDNVALAHHRCNTIRGVDRLPAQLLLIG